MGEGKISKAIAELENDGFVKRNINRNNRRSITLSLTKKGKEKADETLSYARSLSRKMMACLNDSQLKNLDSYLAALRIVYLGKMKDI